jgi:quercetin dioxygenase-like cupin family protein
MSRVLAVVLLLCVAAAAQTAHAPITEVAFETEIPLSQWNDLPAIVWTDSSQLSLAQDALQRKEIFKNNRVNVSLVNIAVGETTPVHKHSRDFISVYLSGDHLQQTVSGEKPDTQKIEAGEVRFRNAGYTHSTKNVGTAPFQAVMVEFADAQGPSKKVHKKSHTCTPNSKLCVDEKELFCTDKVCVEDVEMAPGSVTVRHSHATDHMLVAVSDYELTDEVEGKGTVVRRHKSGEVEYIPAGITHRLTNTGKERARFTVILWK